MVRRFEVRRRLGSGGAGAVFSALDRERGQEVALKVLRARDATALYRFKKEFRSLIGVNHPNLVSLYELIAEGEQWVLAMELVEGDPFLEYVRFGSTFEGSGVIEPGVLDADRLLGAARQLACGIKALHDSGKLHRDLKPSNVLVTREGRVVILDFGLATELSVENQTLDGSVAGTIAYMAPEQSQGRPVTAASDWYAFGVMLFQALTGTLPFAGSIFQVMLAKQGEEAPSPFEIVPDLPGEIAEIAELCSCLLSRDPEARPTDDEIQAILGEPDAAEIAMPTMLGSDLLIGRQSHLEELERAYVATRAGRAVTVYLHGTSGTGKSALAELFLDTLQAEVGALVLRGRCYEHEMVPFKALDGIVDNLCRHLAGLEAEELDVLLPDDWNALLRLFPVLGRVERRRKDTEETLDPLTTRRRAIGALREMLSKLAGQRMLALFVDDLHWADADSTALLGDLLLAPGEPSCLLLATLRSEEVERRDFVRELLERADGDIRRTLEVGPLAADEARNLIALQMPDAAALGRAAPPATTAAPTTTAAPQAVGATLSESLIESLVTESQGNPFLLEQLVRWVRESDRAPTHGARLAEMIDDRLDRLPAGAASLLHVLAVAQRPLAAEAALAAAEVSSGRQQLIDVLRSACLIRTGGSAQRLELYSDRLGEALRERFEPGEMRRLHRRLLEALEAQRIDDPEHLFEHALGAGEVDRAAHLAADAGRRACEALAFDPAARFLRRALELGPPDAPDRAELRRLLAQALAGSGRSIEAAECFLEIAEASAEDQRLAARCRAAEQFFVGSRVERGLETAQRVLADVGVTYPRRRVAAVSSFVWHRLKLRIRGLDFEAREPTALDLESLTRIDACAAIADGLLQIDPLRSADFHTRRLLLALDTGDPGRAGRALAMEVGIRAGTGDLEVAADALARAEELAFRTEDPYLGGLVALQRGVLRYFSTGGWGEAVKALREAENIFTESCRGKIWEIGLCRRLALAALIYHGDLVEAARRLPLDLAEARRQGNLAFARAVRGRAHPIWLAADDPAKARAEAAAAAGGGDFNADGYNAVLAEAQIDLYDGDADSAWEHLMAHEGDLKKSQLLRMPLIRVEAAFARGRVALSRCGGGHGASRSRVDKEIRRLEAESLPLAAPSAALLRAGLARLDNHAAAAREALEAAVQAFEANQSGLLAACSRRRLGEVVGGEGGARLVDKAEQWMRRQRVARPLALIAVYAPVGDTE